MQINIQGWHCAMLMVKSDDEIEIQPNLSVANNGSYVNEKGTFMNNGMYINFDLFRYRFRFFIADCLIDLGNHEFTARMPPYDCEKTYRTGKMWIFRTGICFESIIRDLSFFDAEVGDCITLDKKLPDIVYYADRTSYFSSEVNLGSVVLTLYQNNIYYISSVNGKEMPQNAFPKIEMRYLQSSTSRDNYIIIPWIVNPIISGSATIYGITQFHSNKYTVLRLDGIPKLPTSNYSLQISNPVGNVHIAPASIYIPSVFKFDKREFKSIDELMTYFIYSGSLTSLKKYAAEADCPEIFRPIIQRLIGQNVELSPAQFTTYKYYLAMIK